MTLTSIPTEMPNGIEQNTKKLEKVFMNEEINIPIIANKAPKNIILKVIQIKSKLITFQD